MKEIEVLFKDTITVHKYADAKFMLDLTAEYKGELFTHGVCLNSEQIVQLMAALAEMLDIQPAEEKL